MIRRSLKPLSYLFCFAVLSVMLAGDSSHANSKAGVERNLPNTQRVLSDLSSIERSIGQVDRQLDQLRSTIKSTRTSIKNASSLTKKVGSVEKKISRIRREVESLSKIPQLKIFKPVAAGLKSMGSKVKVVRRKADNLRKTKLDPAAKQLLDLEREVIGAQRKLDQVSLQVKTAKSRLTGYRDRVVRNGNRRIEVTAIESVSLAAKVPVSELKTVVSDIAKIVTDVQTRVSRVRTVTGTINRYAGGVAKIEKKLAPIDKKAKSVSKVMSKKISFKIPFTKKRVTVSVRKILESPGTVLKAAVKPLTAIAKKLLAPLTKKVKFDIKAPKELQQLSNALDSLQRMKFQVSSQIHILRSKVRKLDDAKIKNSLSKLARLS